MQGDPRGEYEIYHTEFLNILDESTQTAIQLGSLIFNFLDWRFWNSAYWLLTGEDLNPPAWLNYIPQTQSIPSSEGYSFTLNNHHLIGALALDYEILVSLSAFDPLISSAGIATALSYDFGRFSLNAKLAFMRVFDPLAFFGHRFGIAAGLVLDLNEDISIFAEWSHRGGNEGHVSDFSPRKGFGSKMGIEINF